MLDPSAALGAPVNVFLTQLPSLYSGCAKNGSPVSYAFAANLSVEGIECLTELENIEKYAWFSTLHRFKAEIARAQTINPDVVRYAAVLVSFVVACYSPAVASPLACSSLFQVRSNPNCRSQGFEFICAE